MPRTGRGGARDGNGKANPNRTDLNSKLPVQTAPGQEYGSQTAEAAAQRSIPMASGGANPLAQAAQSGNPQQVGSYQQSAGAAPQGPIPQPGPGLSAPSLRPNEPVTAGIASGAGPGPEALQSGLPMNSSSQMLSSLAKTSGSADLAVLANAAAAMGQ